MSEDFPVLADFVAGNLLLVIQEAVLNAIKHSSAETINIHLDERVPIKITSWSRSRTMESVLTSTRVEDLAMVISASKGWKTVSDGSAETWCFKANLALAPPSESMFH